MHNHWKPFNFTPGTGSTQLPLKNIAKPSGWAAKALLKSATPGGHLPRENHTGENHQNSNLRWVRVKSWAIDDLNEIQWTQNSGQLYYSITAYWLGVANWDIGMGNVKPWAKPPWIPLRCLEDEFHWISYRIMWGVPKMGDPQNHGFHSILKWSI